jgi:predicted dehydrogenase
MESNMSRVPFSRRRLLQGLGGSLAGSPWLALPASAQTSLPRRAIGRPFPNMQLPGSPPPAPRAGSVGFAVMGLGYYGLAKVMPALAQGQRCHVAAVVSGNPEKAARAAAAYGLSQDATYSYDNFDAIARDERVEAVYIVLPSGLHAEWTARAFAAGKHVLCEKPMALSSAECEHMISAAQLADRKLMIAYRCHFEPYNLRAMELVRAGAVGKVESIETLQQYRSGPTTPADNWRVVRALAGGGPLEDYGIYGLQAALYLGGEQPARISAQTVQPANDPRFTEIFASVRTQMQFPSGASASLFTSYDTEPGRNRVAVTGDAGTLVMEPATGYDGQRMTLTSNGNTEELVPGDPTVQFHLQCDHFADAIRDDVTILTPGEMGLRDVKLMEAIYAAAASGNEVVV